jgi:hypothetical protein
MKITAAAIKVDGKIYTGQRHAQIMRKIWDEDQHTDRRITQDMQGFVTEDGQFWNRYQAGAIAFKAGQTSERKRELFSEDLW